MKQRVEMKEKSKENVLLGCWKPDESNYFAVFQSLRSEKKNKQTAQNNVFFFFFKLPDQNTFHRLKCIFFQKKTNKRQNKHL